MILTRSADYALRALIHLAQCQAGQAERLDSIAKAQRIPPALLSKILQTLVRSGIVRSQKGYGGGYVLVSDPADVSLRQVIELIDGPFCVFECLVDDQFCQLCSDCKLKGKFSELQDTLVGTLARTSLAECLPDPAEARPAEARPAEARPAPTELAD